METGKLFFIIYALKLSIHLGRLYMCVSGFVIELEVIVPIQSISHIHDISIGLIHSFIYFQSSQ